MRLFFIQRNIGYKRIVQNYVAYDRKQTTIKSSIISKKRRMSINRKNS